MFGDEKLIRRVDDGADRGAGEAALHACEYAPPIHDRSKLARNRTGLSR
jgi:hypothetical protein